ncbi:MAG TPA: APC family permease [Candidatus Sulfotelmatobacter sp.]|nr:APC family permease [Candidatus Sulfotelmatobacter sp.]
MSQASAGSTSLELAGAKKQLRREMGFWDVLLFNIATVLGPRWVAAAAHNGSSSISLWVLAAAFFFVPYGLVVNELSSRFPVEGGLYVWAKEAFGDFHGFVAGWNYWIYTCFYFPGLLLASASMSAYIIGSGGGELEHNRTFLLVVSFALLIVAVGLNIIGLNVGKWLQNAGGIATYTPLLMLVGVAAFIYYRHGSVTQFSWATIWPKWDWNTVNFWSQIAFAFTGLELVSAMSEEIRDPQRTLPRALFGSSVMIAGMYIVATTAVLVLAPAPEISPTSGVFHAVTIGSVAMGVGFLGIVAAMLVTVGNAGGVGSTVAGIARVPFIVGIDRYLPPFFGKIHPKWRTPWVSILVQAAISGVVLLISQVSESVRGAYDGLVSITIIIYFIPFLYMFAAVIKLVNRPDRTANPHAVLIPGGKIGVWLTAGIGFLIVLASMVIAAVPPGDSSNKFVFVVKVVVATVVAILFGLVLYWRGARSKQREQAQR